MGKKVSDHVTWVGKTDWQLTKFHGDEYSTHLGSSYNAYLIRDKKTALIDTVWEPFDKEFVSRLKREIDLCDIDFIVMNHNEIDHSGALPELLREIPDVPIYCTARGEAILRGHYHGDWNFKNVHTGDTLSLGDTTLTFIEAPMLHWPDTMFTHLSGDNVLFSNDGFGQHFASESLFDDQVDMTLLVNEAEKYYANILVPFNPMVRRKMDELLSMGLPIDIIAPSHGIIWRRNPRLIIDRYLQWCRDYQENQISIIYDTMWNSTRVMAENIAEGINKTDSDVTVKLFNASHHDKNDIITEVFHSKALIVGSPTINSGISFAMSGIMEMIKGMKFKNKSGASFGSYGWSGEAVKELDTLLSASGFSVVTPGIRTLWVPDGNELERCRQFGADFVASIKQQSKQTI